MKSLNLFCIGTALFLLVSSCKKENHAPTEERQEPGVITVPEKPVNFPFVSYTINGKSYTGTQMNFWGSGNLSINPVDSKGKQDSVSYNRHFKLSSPENKEQFIDITFNKRYAEYELKRYNTLLVPLNNMDLFTVGGHPYAHDHYQEGILNGISIIGHAEESFASFRPFKPGRKATADPESKNDPKFNITKLTKLEDGNYLLEATFEINAFDKNEKPVKVTEGFLRIKVKPDFI